MPSGEPFTCLNRFVTSAICDERGASNVYHQISMARWRDFLHRALAESGSSLRLSVSCQRPARPTGERHQTSFQTSFAPVVGPDPADAAAAASPAGLHTQAGCLSRKKAHTYSLGYLGEPEKNNTRLVRPECTGPMPVAPPVRRGVDQAYPHTGSSRPVTRASNTIDYVIGLMGHLLH